LLYVIDRGNYGRRSFDDSRKDGGSFPPHRIQPLMSFKSFIQSQAEDCPPEVYQSMYQQYNIDYLGYFSESFFKASMAEEWFQDRYNPVSILNIEKESAEWAAQESAHFKKDLLHRTNDFIQACSLEPTSKHRDDSMEEVPLSGKHLPGHENRAIYVSGIHACCTKAVFRSAVSAALTTGENNESNQPERIIVAQPVWSTRNLDKFEK
jgi:hypothetical protein